jgi:opacity protein-like surface antigen
MNSAAAFTHYLFYLERFMKLFNPRPIVAAVAMAAACLPAVSAAQGDWYLSAFAQNSNLDTVNTISSSQVGGVNRRIDLDADDQTGFGLTLGRTIFTQGNGNKISLELSYNNTDFDAENIAFMGNDFLAADGRSEGSLETETILARAVYQFNLGAFRPYVGIGFGEADFEVDGRYGASVGQGFQARPPFITGGDSATAIELRAGLEYSVTESIGVFLEYTSTDVDDIQFSRLGGGPGGLATTTQEGDLSFDSINFGARLRF